MYYVKVAPFPNHMPTMLTLYCLLRASLVGTGVTCKSLSVCNLINLVGSVLFVCLFIAEQRCLILFGAVDCYQV